MKQLLITLLSILYMTSATGATVHVHYCMGKFVQAGFTNQEDEECGRCGMKKEASKSCCKDEHKTIKSSDHQSAKVDFECHYLIALVPSPLYDMGSNNIPFHNLHLLPATIVHPPPLWRVCPLYLSIRNFRV